MSDEKNLLRTFAREVHGRVQAEPASEESGFLNRSLVREVARVNLGGDDAPPAVRRAGTGIDAEAAGREIASLCAAIAPGDSFAILIESDDAAIDRFPGALQRAFLAVGFGLEDLKSGLAWAVDRGLLSVGKRYGVFGEVQTFVKSDVPAPQAAGEKIKE